MNGEHRNVVVYTRVSTPEQAKGGESLVHQENMCLEFAKRNGFNVVAVFREEGASGRTTDRTQLKLLTEYCYDKNNNVSAIICYKLDRFTRNAGDYAYLSNAFKKKNIEIIFTDGVKTDTSTGKLMKTIEAGFAEFESDRIGERINDGVRAAKNSGRYYHKTFGYSIGINKLTNKKQIYPNNDAPKVKRIFELLNDGYNQVQVIEIMKKETGIKIPPQTFEKRIKNALYCGLTYNTEGKLIKGIHEPIISEELFWSVQNRLDKRSSNNKNRNYENPVFPLIDYVYCGDKEHKMTGSMAKKKYAYYHCQSKCSRYPKQQVEEAYSNYLETLKVKEDHLEMLRQMALDIYEQKTANVAEQNKRLETEIVALEKQQLDTLRLMRDKEDITIKKLGEKEMEMLETQIQQKKGCLMDEAKINKITEDCWDFVKFFINNAAIIWEVGNLEIKRGVQSLISPKGFTFKEKVIEIKETPHFISSFKSALTENPVGWRWRELNPRPKMFWQDRYRLSPEIFSRL